MSNCPHTTVPWHATHPMPPKCGTGATEYDWLITGEHTEDSRVVVAHVKGVEGSEAAVKANAEFLVRAANGHYPLVQACMSLLEAMDPIDDRLGRFNWSWARWLLRDAIAKAEGEQP